VISDEVLGAQIEMFDRIAKGEQDDIEPIFADLCIKNRKCIDCVIGRQTRHGCAGSPFTRWHNLVYTWGQRGSIRSREHAAQMREFLKGIRLEDPAIYEFYIKRDRS